MCLLWLIILIWILVFIFSVWFLNHTGAVDYEDMTIGLLIGLFLFWVVFFFTGILITFNFDCKPFSCKPFKKEEL